MADDDGDEVKDEVEVAVKDAAEDATKTKTDANTMILGGVGIGAFGVISAAIGGAVCPVCVVAAPALVGIGAYKRWKAAKAAPPRSGRS